MKILTTVLINPSSNINGYGTMHPAYWHEEPGGPGFGAIW